MSTTKYAQIAFVRKRPENHRKRANLSLQFGAFVGNQFQEMVRGRLRERTESQKALSDFLRLDASIIQRRLIEGGTALCLDFLDDVSTFYQMSVAEMCALPGSLWQEIKPLELQLLRHFREMTELQRHSLLAVLDRTAQEPRAKRRARLGRAELTEEQQLLVDLFARSNEQARSGILKTLKGTATLGDAERGQHRTTE